MTPSAKSPGDPTAAKTTLAHAKTIRMIGLVDLDVTTVTTAALPWFSTVQMPIERRVVIAHGSVAS